MCEILTYQDQVGIREFHQQESICDKPDRRCVEDDEVIHLLKQGKHLRTFFGCNKFRRIRGDWAGHYYVKVRNSRFLDDAFYGAFIDQVRTDAFIVVMSESLVILGFL